MRDLINFNRNNLFPTLFDRFFNHTNDFFRDLELPLSLTNRLDTNFSEESEKYVLELEIPGMKKESISLEFMDNGLQIVAEKKSVSKDTESRSKIQRYYSVPSNIDRNSVSASYIDGVLRIELPKTEKSKVKKIEVK